MIGGKTSTTGYPVSIHLEVFGESNSKLLITERIEKENILRNEIFRIEHKITYQIDTPLLQVSPRLWP
jgi:hypothetical protein